MDHLHPALLGAKTHSNTALESNNLKQATAKMVMNFIKVLIPGPLQLF